MVELLVVIAVIGILIGISIPITRMFTRNDLRDSARTVYTLLRAARVYATTYNVETAVVYALDNPFTRETGGPDQFTPLEDTILPDGDGPLAPLAVRTIRAASVMYRLPGGMNAAPRIPSGVETGEDVPDFVNVMDAAQALQWSPRDTSTFVPTPGSGEMVPLAEGYSLLLMSPREEYVGDATTPQDAFNSYLYQVDYGLPEYDPATRDFLLEYNRQMETWAKSENLWRPSLNDIGMRPVYAYPLTMEIVGGRLMYDSGLVRPYIAHVFNPDGSLKTRIADKERYRIMVAPDPATFPDERVVSIGSDEFGPYRPISIIIEINRSTGSVRIGS